MTAPVITPERTELPSEFEDPDRPWVAIVWNDPVNLMNYVRRVFQRQFGYSYEKADELMLAVHNEGKAAVFSGTREVTEAQVAGLHAAGLWATMAQD